MVCYLVGVSQGEKRLPINWHCSHGMTALLWLLEVIKNQAAEAVLTFPSYFQEYFQSFLLPDFLLLYSVCVCIYIYICIYAYMCMTV